MNQLDKILRYFQARISSSIRHYISLSILFFLMFSNVLGVYNVSAQATIDAGNAESLELRVANLEQQYDSQIIQILTNYFDRKKFFVDVNINAELVDEAIGTSQNQVVTNSRPQQNLFMPGLPFLPDENLRQPSSLNLEPDVIVNQNTIKSLRLINMTVNIYADTSLAAEQLELMRFITRIAIKVNEARGDEIFISQLAIPDYTEKPEAITDTTVTPQPSVPDFNSIFTYIPALALMLLFGLTILINRLVNKPQPQIPIREFREAFKNEYNQVPDKIEIDDSELVGENDSKIDSYVASKEEIVEAFFNSPEEVATIFRYWLSEEEEGAIKAAEVIVATDKHLLRTLKRELHPEDYETLTDSVIDLAPLNKDQRNQIIQEFGSMLKRGAKETISEGKRNKFSIFKFLDHISDYHILTLLETEDSLSGAFILQYLPEDSAAQFIEKLDKEIAAKIMLHMATLNNLTNDQQQKISSELFDKAMDLVEAERSEQYGAEHLYPILERLPVHDQKRYIDELKATGSIVGAILEKQFITIEKLPELSDEVIKKAVRSLNTETLLDAISGLDEDIIEKVLSARPKREQRLLRMELDELQGATSKQTGYAKAILMNSIRKNANDS
jgi:flagellar motor switch protein FliG